VPIKPGRGKTMMHDYKRNGPADLFAAMNIATGELLHDTRRRHAGANVLAFFKWIDLHVERHIDVHVVLDNLSAHKSEPVREWLAHPKQLRSSALDDYFERPLSVEAVGRFKPAAEVYLYAVAELKGAADQA